MMMMMMREREAKQNRNEFAFRFRRRGGPSSFLPSSEEQYYDSINVSFFNLKVYNYFRTKVLELGQHLWLAITQATAEIKVVFAGFLRSRCRGLRIVPGVTLHIQGAAMRFSNVFVSILKVE